jgi:hypothetical protein
MLRRRKHPESRARPLVKRFGAGEPRSSCFEPNSNTPPPTDQVDLVPLWYSFDLVKKRVEEGGWTHQVTQRELPSSRYIARRQYAPDRRKVS